VLVRSGAVVCAVHAGWRGVAAGIIEDALRLVHAESGEPVEVVIGPCAGADRYEVGPEVPDALGRWAVTRPASDPHKRLLDLAGSGVRQIEGAGVPLGALAVAGLCTIADPSFHSFRRDGVARGSNLGFISV
jgi:polyphenol oxidase